MTKEFGIAHSFGVAVEPCRWFTLSSGLSRNPDLEIESQFNVCGMFNINLFRNPDPSFIVSLIVNKGKTIADIDQPSNFYAIRLSIPG